MPDSATELLPRSFSLFLSLSCVHLRYHLNFRHKRWARILHYLVWHQWLTRDTVVSAGEAHVRYVVQSSEDNVEKRVDTCCDVRD
jgi:hypothetical protein